MPIRSHTSCLPLLPRFWVVAILTVLPLTGLTQETVVTHCAGACPQYGSTFSANNSRVVIHHLYAAGLNSYSRRPDWVAYRLSAESVGVASLLQREWRPDPLTGFPEAAELADLESNESLPDITSSVSPYGGSGGQPERNEQNRVRLAPLTGFADTPYWSELNYTSNMLPMPAPLRLGPWLRLEQALNGLLSLTEQVHVIAGPIYFDANNAGSTQPVPGLELTGYYKIIRTGKGIVAFAFPHDMTQQQSFCDSMIPIAELERLTRLKFFSQGEVPGSELLLAEMGCNQNG